MAPHPQDTDLKDKKIAVIGAGFTGLVAALRLSKRGADVTIYEYHKQIGGLVRGHTLKNGTNIERAYHFLYKTDNYIIDLAKELGVGNKLKFYKSSIGAFYKGILYPFVTPLDLIKFKPLPFIHRVRTGFVGLYLQSVKDWHKLTKVTAIEWLTKYNGKKATEILWEPLLRGKFHNYYDKVTMAWLWTRIKVRQDSKDKGETSEKLGYFNGSFDVVITALEKVLKKQNVDIKLSTGIKSINYLKRKNNNIKLTTIADEVEYYDGLVVTTPSTSFAKMLESEKTAKKSYLKKLDGIDYLGAVTMIFTTKQKLSNYYWHQIHDLDAPFLVLLSLTALTKNTKPYGGNSLYYIGDYIPNDDKLMQMTDEEIKDLWFKGVRKLFPNFDKRQVKEASVFKFRNAQHIVDTKYEERKPDYKTPFPNTFLANFSQIFPQDRGTNYAVRDGEMIADMLAEELNK